MRQLTVATTLLGLASAACAQHPPAPPAGPNALTTAEQDAGWRLLFDGASTEGWRAFRADTAPSGWQAVDGTLLRAGAGGDLVSAREFGDFELSLEWRIAACGNSGVMYRVVETEDRTYHSGPEMQVLDDAGHPDAGNRLTSAGAAYDLYPAPAGHVKSAGEWNTARLIVNGNRVEHWLNGAKLLEFEFGSRDWDAKIAASKFKPHATFGKNAQGHIGLQDHGDVVAYRNIKIRVLP